MEELAWAEVELDGRKEGSFPREGTPASWRRALTLGAGGGVGGGGRSLLQSLALRLPAERWWWWGEGSMWSWSYMTAPVWAAVSP